MKVPPAERITLAPLGEAPSDDALVEALALLAEVLQGDRLALGAEVAAPNGVSFVVTGHEPEGHETVGPATSLELQPEGLRRRLSLDVLLLVDASYSMRGRLPAAQAACEDFFRHAQDVAASSALAVFRREPLLLREFALPENQSARILADVEARGPGDVAGALEWGLATLLTRGTREHAKAILVLTDTPDPDPRRTLSVAERARRLGVPLHAACIAPHAKAGGALAEAAALTGGTYRHGGLPGLAFRDALRALAEFAGAPLDLPPEPDAVAVTGEDEGEVEFEIILKSMAPDEGPKLPWTRRE